jgi:hypothetical protein
MELVRQLKEGQEKTAAAGACIYCEKRNISHLKVDNKCTSMSSEIGISRNSVICRRKG